MQEFLDQTYFGNTVYEYLVTLAAFIAGIVALTIFKKIILFRLKKWAGKTETTIDDLLIKGLEKSVLPVLYLILFYLTVMTLELPEVAVDVIDIATVILVTFFFIRVITSAINYALNAYIKKKTPEEADAERRLKQVRGIMIIINFIIWSVGFVFLLDNLGFEISAVIAGLGIGGIAIALAAQTILGDLFSYFIIFFDRPFEIGDFIILEGQFLGTIEYIGLKTTRIRSLSGEQIVISNTDLTNSRIRNYKRMERRRVVFKLGLIYQTTYKQLAGIPQIVKTIIESQENTTFDRGHFQGYGDFSLDFEFVYYVLSSDYSVYMNIQQAVNLKIYEEFEKQGIEFAYPTQTLFLNQENGEDNNSGKN
jgi:small-conductance mechanosensitive channel